MTCSADELIGYMPITGNFFNIWLIISYCFIGFICCYGMYGDLADKGKINCHLPKEYFDKYERIEVLG
jgi:hypothetical protein